MPPLRERPIDVAASASGWWLGEAAVAAPDAPALLVDDRWISYAELAASSLVLARGLAARGVGRGHRIALLATANRGFVETLHAAQRLGAAIVPLGLRATRAERARELEASRPHCVLVDDAASLPALGGASGASLEILERQSLPRTFRSVRSIEVAGGDAEALAVLATSGTSGQPKAVVLSTGAFHASAVAAAERLGYRAGQTWLCVLPLHHVGGLSVLIRAAVLGACVVLRSGFDAGRFSRDVERFEVCHASVVPTMVHRLVLAGGGQAMARCTLLVGGAALGEETARAAEGAGFDLRATYGLTETASQVATTEAGELVAFPGTVGRPLRGVSIEIERPGPDGVGEIVVSGPQLFAGYFGEAAATQAALRNGRFATGDSGRLDVTGRLYVVGRRSDLIVSGGENVRPEEVERALESHASVAEAAVVGAPDPEWGEIVVAYVVPRAGAAIDAAELVAWCQRRLSAFKIPRRIEPVSRLPRTPGGKLMRAKLRRD